MTRTGLSPSSKCNTLRNIQTVLAPGRWWQAAKNKIYKLRFQDNEHIDFPLGDKSAVWEYFENTWKQVNCYVAD